MRKNKKGISPLIATVLIIAFTIAVAVIIMSWGTRFVRDTTKTTSEQTEKELLCATELSFGITNACFEKGTKYLKLTIDNRGEVDIDKFKIRIYEGSSVSVEDLPEPGEVTPKNWDTAKLPPLPAFGAETYTRTTASDSITKVEVIPILAGGAGGKDVPCGNAMDDYIVTDCELSPGTGA